MILDRLSNFNHCTCHPWVLEELSVTASAVEEVLGELLVAFCIELIHITDLKEHFKLGEECHPFEICLIVIYHQDKVKVLLHLPHYLDKELIVSGLSWSLDLCLSIQLSLNGNERLLEVLVTPNQSGLKLVAHVCNEVLEIVNVDRISKLGVRDQDIGVLVQTHSRYDCFLECLGKLERLTKSLAIELKYYGRIEDSGKLQVLSFTTASLSNQYCMLHVLIE